MTEFPEGDGEAGTARLPRVLVITGGYPLRQAPLSGIFVHRQVQALRDLGCDVTVMHPLPYSPRILAWNERRRWYRESAKRDDVDGIPVYRPRYLRPPGSWALGLSSYLAPRAIGRDFARLAQELRPDLVLAYGTLLMGYGGLSLARRAQLPVVCHVLGSDVHTYRSQDPLSRRLTRRVLASADAITAVSKALKSQVEDIAPQRRDVEVVYNGCDCHRFKYDRGAGRSLLKRMDVPRGAPSVLFLGHLLKAKGIFELADAFRVVLARFPEAHLIMVGDGPDRRRFERRLSKYGLERKVRLVGDRHPDDVPAWLSAADVFVLPSHGEGLPNSVMEAMCCERPVVATRVGGIPEAVDHGETGLLVDPGDVHGLSRSIGTLLSDANRRLKMGVQGRRTVQRRFSWRRSAEALVEVFETVLAGRHVGTKVRPWSG